MNKKAIDFRTVTFLLAVVIIAILLLIFYVWQGIEGKEVEGKLKIDSATVHKNHALIDLLNHPISTDKTIGDAVAQGELGTACSEAKKVLMTLYGIDARFVLSFDGDDFCESENSPRSAIKLRAKIPTMNKEIKEVVLEI